MKKTLGIIGGMGPMATACFMKKVIEYTPADTDQEHIPSVILNDVLIPDRTEYILDKSKPSPLPRLLDDIRKLEYLGADCIAITCNTAHYFYDELSAAASVPIISILDSTVKAVRADGKKHKTAILATYGTLRSGVYSKTAEKYGIEPYIPDEDICRRVTQLIYSQVKTGKPHDPEQFELILDEVAKNGCDSVILGCTELSVIYDGEKERNGFIFDSTRLLARECVRFCCNE